MPSKNLNPTSLRAPASAPRTFLTSDPQQGRSLLSANSIHFPYHALRGTLPLTGPLDSGRTVFVTLSSEIMGLHEKWGEKILVGLVSALKDVVCCISVFSLRDISFLSQYQ